MILCNVQYNYIKTKYSEKAKLVIWIQTASLFMSQMVFTERFLNEKIEK